MLELRTALRGRAEALGVFGKAGLLAVVVFATSHLGVELGRRTDNFASVWLANGFVVAALLTTPLQTWPWWLGAGFFGGLASSLLLGGRPLVALLVALCNLLEALLAGWLTAGLGGDRKVDLSEPKALLRFLVFGGLLAPAAAAAVASLLYGAAAGRPPLAVLLAWVPADALGLVLVVPALLELREAASRPGRKWPRSLEGVLLVGATAACSLICFNADSDRWLFLLMPLVVLAALRLGFAGTAGTVLAVAAGGLVSILSRQGAPAEAIRRDIQLVQLLAAVCAVIGLPVAAVFQQSQSRARRYRDLFERMPLPALVFDERSLQILDANEAASSTYGYSAEEFRALTLRDLRPPGDVPAFERAMEAAAQGGSQTAEWRHRRKDGALLRVAIAAQPIPGLGPAARLIVIRDVTEQRRVEDALRASEQALRAAQSVAHVGDWSWHPQTDLVEFSDELFAIYGLDKATFSGKLSSLAPIIHPEDLPELARLIRAVFKDHRPPPHFEYRVIRPDGQVRAVSGVSGTVELDANGRVLVVTGIVQDVTERKQIEEQRRASEEKFAKAFETSSVGKVLSELSSGLIVEVNEAFLSLTGLTREEALGATAGSLNPMGPADLARFREAMAARQSLTGIDFDIKTKDGRVRTTLASFHTLELSGKLHVLGSLLDVTEQRNHEQELRRLAAAVEQTPASVVITDIDGLIVYVNPAFEKVTGYSRAEVLGQNPRVLKSGRQEPSVYGELWRAVSAGKNWQGRLVNRDKHGRLFTEDATIAAVRDERGAICNYVAVKRDVTHELSLQQELAASRRLESIGRLAGGIAHDFNNILAVILFAVDGQRRADPKDTETLLELSQEIGDAAGRARDLTKQLLAFARKQIITPVALDLNTAVTKSEGLLRRLLGEDIALESRLQTGLPAVVCDPSQFQQVVLNLAVNARDAMPRGGSLTLSTEQKESHVPGDLGYPDLASGRFVEVCVADSGPGMPPEVLARLFEPFFTTKEVGKGTGLGLATVHGIVKQSGGAIRCDSAPGKGSVFRFCLPVAETKAAASAAPSPGGEGRGGAEVILLVEDDPHVRRASFRALQSAGYDVRVAADGQTALDLFAKHRDIIDLVVTDVVMPGLSGGELAAQLKRLRPDLHVLFVSGYTDDAIGERGVLAAGVEFLAKPFASAELLARVRQILDGKPSADPSASAESTLSR